MNETALMEALVKAGPISIAVNSKYFDNYKKGVLSKAKCKGGLNGLDHQVLMVVRMRLRDVFALPFPSEHPIIHCQDRLGTNVRKNASKWFRFA